MSSKILDEECELSGKGKRWNLAKGQILYYFSLIDEICLCTRGSEINCNRGNDKWPRRQCHRSVLEIEFVMELKQAKFELLLYLYVERKMVSAEGRTSWQIRWYKPCLSSPFPIVIHECRS
ncbi:hypothetical protein I3843_07G051500 [Carya illinoinensis]|nr:hypothetical protein I3843_07G051500 [Carya illinoinensis]